jgi:hypothetical protein
MLRVVDSVVRVGYYLPFKVDASTSGLKISVAVASRYCVLEVCLTTLLRVTTMQTFSVLPFNNVLPLIVTF